MRCLIYCIGKQYEERYDCWESVNMGYVKNDEPFFGIIADRMVLKTYLFIVILIFISTFIDYRQIKLNFKYY